MTGQIGQALSLFTFEVVLFVFIGAFLMQIIGMVPGLGGPFAVAIILPFTYAIDSMAGIALILGAAVTSATGNSITTILFGVPGSPAGVATLFDGPAMSRRGEASRAIGAAMTSSFVGAVVGAIALVILIPLVRPIIMTIGPAEFAVMIAFAMVFLAAIEKKDTAKALVAGMGGIAFSFVGQELGTATLRYTFGTLYLWDGLQIVPAIIGLFALAEMMQLVHDRRSSIAEEIGKADGFGGIWVGIVDTFRYWQVTLQSSFVGVIVGLIPGLGGASAGLLAYAQSARIAKQRDQYGQGAVEGVIAADAAGNSKEGAALVTTLALGIPGSTTMAIVLVGLVTLGITPGRQLITENIHIVWWMVGLLVLANFMATSMTLLVGPFMAKVTRVPASYVIGPVAVIGLFGAYNTTGEVGDLWTALILGILGYAMIRTGYSRVMFIIGLVMGPLLEQNLLLSYNLYGWAGIATRPFVAFLSILGVLVISWPALSRLRKPRPATATPEAK